MHVSDHAGNDYSRRRSGPRTRLPADSDCDSGAGTGAASRPDPVIEAGRLLSPGHVTASLVGSGLKHRPRAAAARTGNTAAMMHTPPRCRQLGPRHATSPPARPGPRALFPGPHAIPRRRLLLLPQAFARRRDYTGPPSVRRRFAESSTASAARHPVSSRPVAAAKPGP